MFVRLIEQRLSHLLGFLFRAFDTRHQLGNEGLYVIHATAGSALDTAAGG